MSWKSTGKLLEAGRIAKQATVLVGDGGRFGIVKKEKGVFLRISQSRP
jgi:hypothetical protein